MLYEDRGEIEAARSNSLKATDASQMGAALADCRQLANTARCLPQMSILWKSLSPNTDVVASANILADGVKSGK